jgi:hypothetical protein
MARISCDETSSYLLIDRSSAAGCLIHDGGVPVWPAHDPETFKSLNKLARAAGVRLKEVKGLSGKTRGGGRLVFALGREAEPAARLYAHLTLRHVRVIESGALVAGSRRRPDVLVTTPAMVDARLMDALYTNARGRTVPGIICGSPDGGLIKQVIVRAAAARLGDSPRNRFVELYPTAPFERARLSGRLVLGGGATAAEVREALTAGADVVTILSHGDGVDALLNPALTLCPMDELPPGVTAERAPYCQVTGLCFRHGVSVEKALRSGLTLSPRAIDARILVLGVCHGVLCAQGEIDPSWGYLHALLSNGRLGALVTSWSVVTPSPAMLKPLLSSLYSGETLGRATARLNNSPLARKFGVRFCLFGDPDIRVKTAACRPAPARRAKRVKKAEGTGRHSQVNFGDLSFLRAYVVSAASKCSGPLAALAEDALRAVHSYEAGAWGGKEVEGPGDALGERMRKAVLDFLYQRGTVISHDWVNLSVSQQPLPRTPCFNCGLLVNGTVYKFRLPSIAPRRLRICARCSIIEDAPATSDLTISMTAGGRIVLGGTLPRENWTAGLRLGCQNDPESHGHLWPADDKGAPAREFAPPAPWPPGPLKVALVMLAGASISVVNVPGRWKEG